MPVLDRSPVWWLWSSFEWFRPPLRSRELWMHWGWSMVRARGGSTAFEWRQSACLSRFGHNSRSQKLYYYDHGASRFGRDTSSFSVEAPLDICLSMQHRAIPPTLRSKRVLRMEMWELMVESSSRIPVKPILVFAGIPARLKNNVSPHTF